MNSQDMKEENVPFSNYQKPLTVFNNNIINRTVMNTNFEFTFQLLILLQELLV